MLRICLKNTTRRSFLLSFLKKASRLEAAGTKYDTIFFKMSDVDTTKRRTVETELNDLRDMGCEVYLETDLKRLVPSGAAARTEARPSEASPAKPSPSITRVLDRAYGLGSGEQDVRPLFSGTPTEVQMAPPDIASRPASEAPLSREAPMEANPGMESGGVRQIALPTPAESDAGTPVPMTGRRRRSRITAAVSTEAAPVDNLI